MTHPEPVFLACPYLSSPLAHLRSLRTSTCSFRCGFLLGILRSTARLRVSARSFTLAPNVNLFVPLRIPPRNPPLHCPAARLRSLIYARSERQLVRSAADSSSESSAPLPGCASPLAHLRSLRTSTCSFRCGFLLGILRSTARLRVSARLRFMRDAGGAGFAWRSVASDPAPLDGSGSFVPLAVLIYPLSSSGSGSVFRSLGGFQVPGVGQGVIDGAL